MPSGTLYVLATPIGNLGDLTLRATELLQSASVVAAEDTRRTRRLLESIGAHPERLISYHAHSDDSRAEKLMEILQSGVDVVLATDAGTPGVSDPGVELVQLAHNANVTVVPIPGPSAVSVALSASGLPADRYLFLGFIPRKGQKRQERLSEISDSKETVVLFEAANRMVALLDELAAVAGGDRRAIVGRELTKMHEELRPGTLADLANHYRESEPRGEVTLVVAGGPGVVIADPDIGMVSDTARGWLSSGESRREVARRVSSEFGIPRNQAYKLVMDIEV